MRSLPFTGPNRQSLLGETRSALQLLEGITGNPSEPLHSLAPRLERLVSGLVSVIAFAMGL